MIPSSPHALVMRTSVVQKHAYNDYLQELRFDFFYSCAYCFMSEEEAHGIAFEIDHYLPKTSRPELSETYSNLMYCCKICNRYKLDKHPRDAERTNGFRFFRADTDFFGDHYQVKGILLEPKSAVGEYTIEICYLNRKSMRILRDHRKRIADCDEQTMIGMTWLRKFHIDRLPQELRLKGKKMIEEAVTTGDNLKSGAELARFLNKSDLLEPNDDAELKERKRRLSLLKQRMLA